MSDEELWAWILLYSGGVGLMAVYWLAVALAWGWNKLVNRESRYKRMKRRMEW